MHFRLYTDLKNRRCWKEKCFLRSQWIIKYGGWAVHIPLTLMQCLDAEYSVRYSRYNSVRWRILWFGPVSVRHRGPMARKETTALKG
jgi:hypothetical protein